MENVRRFKLERERIVSGFFLKFVIMLYYFCVILYKSNVLFFVKNLILCSKFGKLFRLLEFFINDLRCGVNIFVF